MEKYCSIVGMRIKPGDCGTFEKCGDPAQCGLRKYYGWGDSSANCHPKPEPGLEVGNRTCNVCHQHLKLSLFRVRKDKKDHKKTCINCEDKYFNKTAVKKPAKKKKYAVKNWHDVAPPPNLPTEDPAIDLSGFTWIKNNYSRTTVALVRIREGEITFNAAARELYVRAWRAKQKGVVNPSLREILEVER